jgi:hypothetical protein
MVNIIHLREIASVGGISGLAEIAAQIALAGGSRIMRNHW